MNLSKSRRMRRWSVRVLDTCAQACFCLALAVLAVRDRLEPPPPPLPAESEDPTPNLIVPANSDSSPLVMQVAPPNPYQPTPVEAMAAQMVEQTGRTVLLLYGSKTGDPRFILHPEQACTYLEVPRS